MNNCVPKLIISYCSMRMDRIRFFKTIYHNENFNCDYLRAYENGRPKLTRPTHWVQNIKKIKQTRDDKIK